MLPWPDGPGVRYRIERELGRGGMAVVFLAFDKQHERHVALKILLPEFSSAVNADRFRREIVTAAGLVHPHIVGIHDSGETAGLHWYVMPWIRGESLRDRLRHDTRMPVADALRITEQAAAALEYAHRHGFVHRDIKPENILLTEDGLTLVADFGVSRALDRSTQAKLTATGFVIGTPAYMAPEQALGEREVDGRADQYALAATTYEMLTGHPPFALPGGGPTPITRRLTGAPPSARDERSDLSPAVSSAVQRGLALEASDRFPSMADFAAAMRAPGRAASTRPWRWLAVAAALTVAGLAARAGWSRWVARAQHVGTVRIAVLPFENLGDSTDAYFAEGVSDAVRAKLTALPGVVVIARGSSTGYRTSTRSPEVIAQELDVRYLLTGTVRWLKERDVSRVQVSPELVEVKYPAAAESRWGEPFDATLTDVFTVQSEIAGRVAGALDLALTRTDREVIDARPTANLAAWDAFLRGEALSQTLGNWNPPDVRRAAAYYAQAVALDSSFALAWARLAQAWSTVYYVSEGGDSAAARSARALARARELAPAAPATALAAIAHAQWAARDLASATAIADTALARTPNDGQLLAAAGDLDARTGRLATGLERLDRARRIDPRSVGVVSIQAAWLLYARRYAEADSVARSGLEIDPVSVTLAQLRAQAALGRGDLSGAERVARTFLDLPGVDRAAAAVYFALYWDLYWILSGTDQRLVLAQPPEAFGGAGHRAAVHMQLERLRGDSLRARTWADSTLRAFPDRPGQTGGIRIIRALALGQLGRVADAETEADRALALTVASDPIERAYHTHQLARIRTLTGDHAGAVQALRRVLAMPYVISPAWLRIDPNFATLRGTPAFDSLIVVPR